MKSIFQVFTFSVFSKVIMGITGILLIHYMSLAEYASFTLAFSMMTLVTQAMAVSFNRIYIVAYERLNLARLTSSFLGFQLSGILVLAVIAYPWAGKTGFIYWFTVIAIIATCLSEYSKTFFQEKMQFLSFSAIEMGRTFLITIGTLSAIYVLGAGIRAWHALLVQALAMLAVFTVSIGNQLKIKEIINIAPVIKFGQQILRGSLVYLFAYYFLFSFFGQIDVFMLKMLSDDAALATYGSALRYYAIIIMALNSVNAVLLPMTQKAQSAAEINSIFHRYTKLIILFVPLVLAGIWFCQWIIPWIDSGKYPQAIPVFRLLAISSIISFAFSPHANLVMKYERFRFLFILALTAIGLGIILNMLLIPRFGAVGTSISTLVSFAYVNSLTFLKSRKIIKGMLSAEAKSNVVKRQLEPSGAERQPEHV